MEYSSLREQPAGKMRDVNSSVEALLSNSEFLPPNCISSLTHSTPTLPPYWAPGNPGMVWLTTRSE